MARIDRTGAADCLRHGPERASPPVWRGASIQAGPRRTILYAAIMLVVGGVMIFTLGDPRPVGHQRDSRSKSAVCRPEGRLDPQRPTPFRVLNKALETRRFVLAVEGLQDAEIEIVGASDGGSQHRIIEIGPDRTLEVRVLVTRHGGPMAADSVPLSFVIKDEATGEIASVSDKFRGPHK